MTTCQMGVNLAEAVENFIRNRTPEHTGPYCRIAFRNPPVPPDKWIVSGAQDHCSLCLLNRALEQFDGTVRQVLV